MNIDINLISPILVCLQSWPAEAVSAALFLTSVTLILFFLRFFGCAGLYVYNSLAVVIANIQVLKLSPFTSLAEPVALGTVVFATIFLTSDIITEHYGKKAAQRGIGICFLAQGMSTLIFLLTLGHEPIPNDPAHHAMEQLFIPSPRLLVASLVAFALSQLFEISLFNKMSELTNKKFLWLRTNVAMILSALLDNLVFSTLAWVILSPIPVTAHTLIFTYILGTYLARVLISFCSTPVMYLSYKMMPRVP